MPDLWETELQGCMDEALASSKFNVIAAVGIDNFAPIVAELGIEYYESFFCGLVKYLSNLFDAKVFSIAFDSFFILTEFSTIDSLSETIIDYSVSIRGPGICIAAYIGYVVFDCYDSTLPTKAFTALKLAKEYKRFVCCYNTASDLILRSRNRMQFMQFFHECVSQSNFDLFVQPVVGTENKSLCFYEVLFRLVAEENIMSAGEFISQAEYSTDVRFIDRLVLEKSIDMLRLNPDLVLSVNVSVKNLCDKDWLDYCVKAVDASLLAGRLIIEITETAASYNDKQLLHFIAKMRELKIKIALDDFGSGNTSFIQLNTLPVDFVKVGDCFVRDLLVDDKNKEFIAILVQIAHRVGAKVVAERVESEAQVSILREMGIDFLQGNIIGKPKIWNNS